jgi:hypothetical protein
MERGLANYGLQAKSAPSPGFVNKVLLEHSCAHIFVVHGCFPAIMAEWKRCHRECTVGRAKNTIPHRKILPVAGTKSRRKMLLYQNI